MSISRGKDSQAKLPLLPIRGHISAVEYFSVPEFPGKKLTSSKSKAIPVTGLGGL
jgi:hypothetical protein